jgi:UDP-glucose 4-epimerase
MNEAVLVTGCAGFIGSNLVDRLLAENFDVIGMDNFDDYYPRAIKERNLTSARRSPRFRFIQDDVRNWTTLEKVIKTNSIAYVCHLAARPGVRMSIKSPLIYHDTNVTGTLSVLLACLNSNIRKLIYASSSSVYGNAESLPTSENAVPKPLSPYGASKLAAEEYCLCFERTYGLRTLILRYFTVYGPRQRPDEAACKFLNQILKGEKVTIYGDGSQVRDFTYVSDVVNATVAAMKSTVSGAALNIGSGRKTSVNQLTDTLEEITRRKIARVYMERQEGDVVATWADIRKARGKIGFEPKIDLREGLRRFFEWYLSQQETVEP